MVGELKDGDGAEEKGELDQVAHRLVLAAFLLAGVPPTMISLSGSVRKASGKWWFGKKKLDRGDGTSSGGCRRWRGSKREKERAIARCK